MEYAKVATKSKYKYKTITIRTVGKKPISFKKGALKQQLGVAPGKPIPKKKLTAAKKRVKPRVMIWS